MNGIKWVLSEETFIGDTNAPYISARVGGFYMAPSPIVGVRKNKIVGWCHQIFYGKEYISLTKRVRLEESSQKNAEKLVLEYLLGCGSTILKGLKEVGLLENALSEIGVDI